MSHVSSVALVRGRRIVNKQCYLLSDCTRPLTKRRLFMAGVKRSHDGTHGRGLGAATASPFMPMFESFRSELDEHHDRRERIIKAGRDVTALSKKM